jgi:hypothetical protein
MASATARATAASAADQDDREKELCVLHPTSPFRLVALSRSLTVYLSANES